MCYEPEHHLSHGRVACWVTTCNSPPVAIWQPALTATKLLNNNLVAELLYCFFSVSYLCPRINLIFIGLLPNVTATYQATPCYLHLFPGPGQQKQYITYNSGVSKQYPSPEPHWLLSEPWTVDQIQVLGCVWKQMSVFVESISSQEASLHSPMWSLTCRFSEPTHWNPVRDVFSLLLSSVTSSLSLSPLTLFFSLSLFPSPLIPWSLSQSVPLALSLRLFSPLLSFSLTPISAPLQNTNIAIHSLSHTLQREVFNWYIMSLEHSSD